MSALEKKVETSELRFDRNQTLLLQLGTEESILDLPHHVRYKDHDLTKKHEFHLTIIGNATGSLLEYFLFHDSSLEHEINERLLSYHWVDQGLKEYYLLRAPATQKAVDAYHNVYYEKIRSMGMLAAEKLLPPGERISIIELRRMADLQEFYLWLNGRIREKFPQFEQVPQPIFPLPVPHVTIYTNGTGGIGIYSEEDFKKYMVRKVKREELEKGEIYVSDVGGGHV